MKKLLLITSVFVVMICNIVIAGEFSLFKIDWSDSPEKAIEKILNSGLGKYDGIGEIGFGQSVYPDIFTSYYFTEDNLKGEEVFEEVVREQKVFFYRPYYTGVYSKKVELKKPDSWEHNILPTQAEVFYSRDTNEILGYTLTTFVYAKTEKDYMNVDEYASIMIKKHGPPTKILNENDKHRKTYKWEKNGELFYTCSPSDTSLSIVIVNIDRLRKHIKRIKKEAKKEGYIK